MRTTNTRGDIMKNLENETRNEYDALISKLLKLAVEKYQYLELELLPVDIILWDPDKHDGQGGEIVTTINPINLIKDPNGVKFSALSSVLNLLNDAHIQRLKSDIKKEERQ